MFFMPIFIPSGRGGGKMPPLSKLGILLLVLLWLFFVGLVGYASYDILHDALGFGDFHLYGYPKIDVMGVFVGGLMGIIAMIVAAFPWMFK